MPGAVPALAGFTGYFLHLEEGREFLARVPRSPSRCFGPSASEDGVSLALLTRLRGHVARAVPSLALSDDLVRHRLDGD